MQPTRVIESFALADVNTNILEREFCVPAKEPEPSPVDPPPRRIEIAGRDDTANSRRRVLLARNLIADRVVN